MRKTKDLYWAKPRFTNGRNGVELFLRKSFRMNESSSRDRLDQFVCSRPRVSLSFSLTTRQISFRRVALRARARAKVLNYSLLPIPSAVLTRTICARRRKGDEEKGRRGLQHARARARNANGAARSRARVEAVVARRRKLSCRHPRCARAHQPRVNRCAPILFTNTPALTSIMRRQRRKKILYAAASEDGTAPAAPIRLRRSSLDLSARADVCRRKSNKSAPVTLRAANRSMTWPARDRRLYLRLFFLPFLLASPPIAREEFRPGG